jgi:hypothetical protein
MISLKTFCEDLAPLVGLTPAALYERQRALVRMGDLPEPVKGRGKGLHATPATVATLLVAVMVTDNLSDTDLRVRRLAQARYLDPTGRGGHCKLTGKQFFIDAFAAILGSERMQTPWRITVHRAEAAAQIFYFKRGEPLTLFSLNNPEQSYFGRSSNPSRMTVQAILENIVVAEIKSALRRIGMAS